MHFDKSEPLWFQLLFKVTHFFPGAAITDEIGKFINILGNVVLVNNYSCVKGLEFSNVLQMSTILNSLSLKQWQDV